MDTFTQVFLLLWIQKSSLICCFFLLMFLQFFSFLSAHDCRAFQNMLQNVKWLLDWWLQASPPFVVAKKMYLFPLFYYGSELIAIASSTWKEQLWNLTNSNDRRTQLPSPWTGNSQEISLSSFSCNGFFILFLGSRELPWLLFIWAVYISVPSYRGVSYILKRKKENFYSS